MIPALQPNQSLSLSAVRYNPDDSVSVVLTFPTDFLPDFSSLVASTEKVITRLRFKAAQAKASFRSVDPDAIQKRKTDYKNYTARVLAKYDKYILTLSHRAACNAVKADCLKAGEYITCYAIELIAREAGRLSKRKAKANQLN